MGKQKFYQKKSKFGSETIDKLTGNNPMDKYFAKNIILVRHFIGFDSSVSNRHYLFHFNHIKTIYILTGIQFKPRQIQISHFEVPGYLSFLELK